MALAVDWVEYNARRHGSGDALENADVGIVTTWAELEEQVAAAAGLLRHQLGVARGDRVVVLAENDVRIFVLQFAVMRLGAMLVPLNWRLSTAELAVLARECRPKVVAHDRTWVATARELAGLVGAATLPWGDPHDPAGFDAGLKSARPIRDEGIRTLADPTHILYTSGTTGLPKGALVTAETLSWQTMNVATVDAISGPGDRMLCPLPLFHAGGLNTVANPILISGGCVGVLARFDPAQCLRLLSDERRGFTHFASVPTMLQLITDQPEFEHARFTTIKHMQFGGGVASQRLLKAWADKGVELQAHYGGTEMGPAIAAMPRSSAQAKNGSCGFPVRHSRLRVVTPNGREAATGEVGEIWVSGPSVTPGYFENSAADQASFKGEWFRTGDAGRFDDDGFLYLVDRYKDMYKSGGENVFPAEVERVLLEHPDIAEAVVVGVPDAKWGETGIALVVPRGTARPTLEDLRAHCVGRLARYKLPTALDVVESLPRNVTGKVVKADIRADYLRRTSAISAADLAVAVVDEVEQAQHPRTRFGVGS